ncbi:hypothetical protein H8D57_01210 [bacterium]|nr:hypothetical protein [bacterium]
MHAEKTLSLTRRILRCANQGNSRYNFLLEISQLLFDFTNCDALEILHRDGDLIYSWEAKRSVESTPQFDVILYSLDQSLLESISKNSSLNRLCRYILSGDCDLTLPCFIENGCFWTGNIKQLPDLIVEEINLSEETTEESLGEYPSMAILQFDINEENSGLLILKSYKQFFFAKHEIKFYKDCAQTLGLAAADRRTQAALKERVKELTCLYEIARIAKRVELTLQEKLRQIVELLPSSWQHPDIAVARITLDDFTCTTSEIKGGCYRQFVNIEVRGFQRGIVEVIYTDEKPELEVAPFLKEEANLIDEVAWQIGAIVEKTETETEKTELHEQLRHADRLATIGQLTAGIAHELNEPLGSILGFAQLARKSLPNFGKIEYSSILSRDLEKIEKASLRARDIIREMLIFARQMPTKKTTANLNRIVDEALFFFQSRLKSDGIEVITLLDRKLPRINADPAQVNQLFVNLIVNALQAMPNEGKLTIQTKGVENGVILSVKDTGVGMSEEVKKQIFDPFFTTKDVNEGTGLGLSVVHGIVKSHGGTIEVRSSPRTGTCFEIYLPVSSIIKDKAQE